MPLLRLALLCALALVLTGTVQARALSGPAAPAGLKPFLLRADESARHEFPRTPSFSWAPVQGALRYEFELAKTPRFDEGSVFWADARLKTPAVSVPIALPWMTGSPYAAYARVRAITRDGVSAWSRPYGFNVRWANTPRQLTAPAGLSRWTVVEGATAYHVWFTDLRKTVATRTNAVDHREFYAFHQQAAYSGTVRFRVRAVRNLYGEVPNGLPAVSYGPWSPVYTSTNPPLAAGPLAPSATLADSTTSTGARAGVHELTPAFTFSGTSRDGIAYGLYRAYVFSDSDCVNVIFRGAVVGSPAYAPRLTGPLRLPRTGGELARATTTYLPDGDEPRTFLADGSRVQTTEMDKAPTPPGAPAAGADGAPPAGDAAATPPAANPSLPATPVLRGAPVELWDSGWPTGRFYWTVVPVEAVAEPGAETAVSVAAPAGATTLQITTTAGFAPGVLVKIGSGATAETVLVAAVGATSLTVGPLTYAHAAGEDVASLTAEVRYLDAELPQDACAAGRVQAFGKASAPVLTSRTSPYVSGLSPRGRLVAAPTRADRRFYGSPLVAWEPSLGADQYQVQWSRRAYPWVTAGERTTYATSALLPLSAGTWHYRVRGVNFALPGTARALAWSAPVAVTVATPTFAPQRRAARPLAAGLELWEEPGDAFSIGLPRGWQTLGASDARLAQVAVGLPTDGQVQKLAVATAPGAGPATLGVVESPRPLTAAQALALARKAPGRTTRPRLTRVGAALRVEYRARYVATPPLAHLVYVFNAADRAYVLTFTAPPATLKRLAPLAARTASTFRLG